MKPFPLITAHTGCMNTPENSLQSVEAGLAHGADIVEDDIRVTRDGVLVLSHDDTVLFANGAECRISRTEYAELIAQGAMLRHGEQAAAAPVAKLEAALELVRESGKLMNLDLKSDACIEPVSELIRKMDMLERVFLTGCPYDWACKAQTHDPRLKKLLNTDVALFESLTYEEAVNKTCEAARDAGCIGINIPYRIVKPALLESASEFALPVYVWTVNDGESMKCSAEMGVRSITTKEVALLAQMKRGWEPEEAGPWDESCLRA